MTSPSNPAATEPAVEDREYRLHAAACQLAVYYGYAQHAAEAARRFRNKSVATEADLWAAIRWMLKDAGQTLPSDSASS